MDMELASKYERELRHDVMAHVHALGDQVPVARGIIHLGATSCYITDNSELIQMRDALDILIPLTWNVVRNLSRFALEHRSLATLAYTHFQPAQPTTVGKRACLWAQDFMYDAIRLEEVRAQLRFRGVKGTTGTQASFFSLFDDDHEKVKQLDEMVTQKMGFEKKWSVAGQTYTRKQDFTVLSALAGLGQSCSKMANDIRLLQHMKEVEEPFEKTQIGSSAMAYKRNPMRSERMNSLARFLQSLLFNPAETASTQWLERSLDDSANRRLAVSEAFLTADALLQLALNVTSGLVVYPKVIEKHLLEELPFMATETILMEACRSGGDRQVRAKKHIHPAHIPTHTHLNSSGNPSLTLIPLLTFSLYDDALLRSCPRQTLHEAIRQHSMAAGARVKVDGGSNDLLQRIRDDDLFSVVHHKLDSFLDPSLFVGRAPEQVIEFVNEEILPELRARGLDETSSVATGAVHI